MKIQRTANAGVLISTDSIELLLDGVCHALSPYEGTPPEIKSKLSLQSPDAVMFTHYHDDHYHSDFCENYKTKTLRPVYGPEFPLFGRLGDISIKGVPTRHIGKNDIAHVSYIIKGKKCIWFMGDASPLDAKKLDEQKPHVLIVPYAYVTTKAAWEITKSLRAEKIILVHMPPRDNDPYSLWQAVQETAGDFDELLIPKMGEVIQI